MEHAHRLPAAARSLPPAWFTDPARFDVDEQSVLARTWIAVARSDELSPGAYLTFQLGREPIVVTRDRDGVLRAFPNICRHRSITIVEGRGPAPALQCPYHRWTWSLDGRLAGAPEMRADASFDLADWCLQSLRVEEWQGWVLVNLDPAARPFAEDVPHLTDRVAEFDLSAYRTGPTVSYRSRFNWKIQVENFAESYHHFGVHADSLEPYFPGNRSWASPNEGEPWMWLDHVSVVEDLPPFIVGVAFPMLMFSITRSGAAIWFKLQPLAVDDNLLDIVVLLAPDTPDEVGAELADTIRVINDEDVPVNERTHAGLRSRFAVPGPVAELEFGCWQFRSWYLETVGTPVSHPVR